MRYGIVLVMLLGMLLSASAQTDPARATVHVVQRGETLSSIAQRYQLSVDTVARANGIINPSNIQAGQRLLIPLAGSTSSTAPQTYTVQPADNLQAISAAFGVDVDTLVRLNSLENPNALYVGQVLILREGAPTSSTGVNTSAQPTPVGIAVTHRIQSGETLFRIAQRYGVSMESIQAANGITDPSRILAGQELTIPNAQVSSPSALPANIASLDVTPLSWTEGKTGRLRLTTTNPASVSISVLDQTFDLAALDNGQSHIGFVAIPLGITAGIYPLTITVSDASGVNTIVFNVQVNAGRYGAQYVTLPADKQNLLAPAVEQNETDMLRRITTPYTAERFFNGPMSLPAAAAMYSAYGAKRAYNGGALDRYHTGADFAGAPGTPVLAAAGGRVVLADTLNIRGNTIVIDHGWGIYTLYAHLNERYASIGTFVQAGQTIGTIGATGRATGAHLHWEVWVRGTVVDPMQWVAQAFP